MPSRPGAEAAEGGAPRHRAGWPQRSRSRSRPWCVKAPMMIASKSPVMDGKAPTTAMATAIVRRRPPTLLPPPFRRPAQGVGKRAFAFALRLMEEALLAARDALARLRPRFRRVVEPHGQRDALARHVDLQHLSPGLATARGSLTKVLDMAETCTSPS